MTTLCRPLLTGRSGAITRHVPLEVTENSNAARSSRSRSRFWSAIFTLLILVAAGGIWMMRIFAGGSARYWFERSGNAGSELWIRKLDSSPTQALHEITFRVRADSGDRITSCRVLVFDDRNRDLEFSEGERIIFEQTPQSENLVRVLRIGPVQVTWNPSESRYPTLLTSYEVNHSQAATKRTILYIPSATTQPANPDAE